MSNPQPRLVAVQVFWVEQHNHRPLQGDKHKYKLREDIGDIQHVSLIIHQHPVLLHVIIGFQHIQSMSTLGLGKIGFLILP